MLNGKFKKVAALLTAAVMSAAVFAGCGNSSDTAAKTDAGTVSASAENSGGDSTNVEFEKTTIGVYSFDWTSSPYSEWKSYLENYIGPHYNVEFVFSTESGDAEGEKTFMEKMGAVGASGVMAVSTYSLDNCLSIASQYQMYFLTLGMMDTDLSTFTEEQLAYYAGECGTGQSSRIDGGHDLAMKTVDLLNKDEKMTIKMVGISPASGMPPVAPPLLQQKGVEQAVEELQNQGMDIDYEEVYVSGFAAEDWAEATDNALALIGSTDNAALICQSIDYSVQPILNAGMQGKIIVTGISGVQEGIAPYFEDGTVDACLDFGYSCTTPATGFIQLYDAITGYQMMGEDGYPARVEMTSGILVEDVETYDDMLDHSYEVTGETYYTYDLIDQYLNVCNPDTTVSEFTDFVNIRF